MASCLPRARSSGSAMLRGAVADSVLRPFHERDRGLGFRKSELNRTRDAAVTESVLMAHPSMVAAIPRREMDVIAPVSVDTRRRLSKRIRAISDWVNAA